MSKQLVKVPTLAELHEDNEDAQKLDALKLLLNQPVPQAWVKKHPMTGNAYLPVDKVEWLLDKIFLGGWRREITEVFKLENSVVVTVRLHYFNPITEQWSFHDGVGAKSLQVDSGFKASDLSAIKDAAVQMAAPAAASYALKDAADNLGKLFGRDLARKDTLAYDPVYKEGAAQATSTTEKPPPPPPPVPAHVEAKQVAAFPTDAFATPTTTPAITFPDMNNAEIDF